jgi:hypothetical protein
VDGLFVFYSGFHLYIRMNQTGRPLAAVHTVTSGSRVIIAYSTVFVQTKRKKEFDIFRQIISINYNIPTNHVQCSVISSTVNRMPPLLWALKEPPMKLPALFLATFLLWLALPPPQVSAAADNDGLIVDIDLYLDNSTLDCLYYNPSVTYYELILPAACNITLKIRGSSSDVLLTADNASARGSLTYTRSINQATIITVAARASSSQFVYIVFTLATPELPDDDPPPDDSEPEPPTPDPPQDQPEEEDTPAIDPGLVTPDATESGESERHTLLLQIDQPLLVLDGLEYPLDTAPFLHPAGYTMVPLRFIAEALGGMVIWDPEQQKVDIYFNGNATSLYIGQALPDSAVGALIRDGRTFVPLRYVMETLGAYVEWINEGKYIIIIYPA